MCVHLQGVVSGVVAIEMGGNAAVFLITERGTRNPLYSTYITVLRTKQSLNEGHFCW